ncbi:RNA-directed DNA polymerase, eukaryota, reverse transcriptase zinc-binding domain protein, partial [Tanacetum coccineum]
GSRVETSDKEVLDVLKPDNDGLKKLEIVNYGRLKFPKWVGDPSFRELAHVSIRGCKKCTSLPPLGQLPSLKELSIQDMDGLKGVGLEFLGTGAAFPSLEILKFEGMSGWEVPAEPPDWNDEFKDPNLLLAVDTGSAREELESNESVLQSSKEQLPWTSRVRLNESRCFTVSAMRKHIESFTLSTDAEKIRWNNLIPIKLNILTWRISLVRIPTRSNLDSRGIDLDSILCPVCNDEIETSKHLLIDCSIAKSSWILVSKWWGFHDYPKDLPSLIKWADNTNLPTKSARIFDAVVQTTLWAIWNLRNRICFESKPPRKDLIGNDIKLLSHLWISHRSRNCKPCWLNWTSDPAIACSYL